MAWGHTLKTHRPSVTPGSYHQFLLNSKPANYPHGITIRLDSFLKVILQMRKKNGIFSRNCFFLFGDFLFCVLWAFLILLHTTLTYGMFYGIKPLLPLDLEKVSSINGGAKSLKSISSYLYLALSEIPKSWPENSKQSFTFQLW